MIHRVMLNARTGSIDVDPQRSKGDFTYNVKESYTEEYLVITDHDDSVASIYNSAGDYKPSADCYELPTYSTKLKSTRIPVSSISIDRWDTNNMKSVPSYGLPAKSSGSYAAWKYTVTYKSVEDTSEDPPWEEEFAQNCSLTGKEYTIYTAKSYKSNLDAKEVLTRNAVGDSVYRNVTKRNFILSFDYPIQKFSATHVVLATNTVNAKDITVAGVDIPAGCGALTSLNVSLEKWKDKTYYKVHVEIELGVSQSVAYTELIGTGYNAYAKAGDKQALPIHRFTGTLQDASLLKSGTYVWFDKDRKLGSFSGAVYTDGTACKQYEAVQDAMVLNKDGTLLTGVAEGEALDMDALKTKLNIIICPERPAMDWRALSLPKKGLCWKGDSGLFPLNNAWKRSLVGK